MPKYKSVKEMTDALENYQKADKNKQKELSDQIAEGLGFAFYTKEEKERYMSILKRVNPNGLKNKAFDNAGLHEHAVNRQNIAFTCYLMSKKNMSFKDANYFAPGDPGFDETLADFHKFLEDHPVKGKPADEIEANVGEWTEIFMKAAEKYSEYTFPDIDYMNPDEVRKHSYEFERVQDFVINYSQEFDRILDGGNRAFAEKKVGGSNKLSEKRFLVEGSQDVVTRLQFAYMSPQYDPNQYKISPDRWLARFAQDRISFGLKFGENIRGKSIKDTINSAGVKSLYNILASTVTPVKISGAEAKDYFINGLSQKKKAEYKKAVDDAEDLMRRNYNSSFQSDGVINLADDLITYSTQKGIAWDDFFAAEDDPAQLVGKINSDMGAGVREAFKKVYGRFLASGTSTALWKLTGIDKPINIIRIGGKTPEELWGDKVKDLNNEADKETYYQTMIIKEAQKGDKAITTDLYYIDSNYKIKKNEVAVIKDSETLNKEFAFFKGVANLHEMLDGLMKDVLKTGKDGSDSYKDMVSALEKCVKSTEFTEDYGFTATNVVQNLKELEKASKEYYKRHTGFRGIFSAHYEDGKKRLETSKYFKDGISAEIEKLKDLGSGLNLAYDDKTFGKDFMERRYKLGAKWKQFKAQTTLRADGRENTLQNVEKADLYREFKPADKYLADAEMKVYMRKKLDDASKTTTRGENLEAGFGGAFSNAYPLAKKYVYREFSNMIRNAGRGGSNPSVQELDNIFGKEDFLKTYQKQIDDLASNKEFRELAEKSPKTCIAKWSKLVRQQPQVARVDQAPQNAVVNAPENAPKQKVTDPKKVETKAMGKH